MLINKSFNYSSNNKHYDELNFNNEIYKSNSNRNTISLQEFSKIDPYPSEDIVADPLLITSQLSQGHIKALNYICGISNNCKYVWPEQRTIAKNIGYSVRQTQRILDYLISRGYIAKRYRHLNSCVYKPSEFFYDLKVRKILKYTLYSLKYKCTVRNKTAPEENNKSVNMCNVVQYYTQHNYKKHSTLKHDNRQLSNEENTRAYARVVKINFMEEKSTCRGVRECVKACLESSYCQRMRICENVVRGKCVCECVGLISRRREKERNKDLS